MPASRRILLSLSVLCGPACREESGSPPLVTLIDGSWQSECLPHEGPFLSQKISYRFENARQAEREEAYFADASCAVPAGIVNFSGNYELEVTREVYRYRLNLFYEQLTALPSDSSAALELQAMQYCGISDWSSGREQDITLRDGGDCPAFGVTPVKNWNFIEVKRGLSLAFGTGVAHDNSRPETVAVDDPSLFFTNISTLPLTTTEANETSSD